MPLEPYRIVKLSETKSDMQSEDQLVDEDWSMDVNVFDELHPDHDEYGQSSELSQGEPSQMRNKNNILNRTHAGMTLEETYAALDMRESYLQRHTSSVAQHSETTTLQMKEFGTKTDKVWRADAANLFSDCDSLSGLTEEIYRKNVSFKPLVQ